MELTYSTRYSDRAVVHFLHISSSTTVLGWKVSGRTPVTVTTTKNEPQRKFQHQDDNSPEHSSNRFEDVESVEQSAISRHQASKQMFNKDATQQHDGICVAKLPTEESKQCGFYGLSARQLRDQYQYFLKTCEQLSNKHPVNSQGVKQRCNVLPHSNVQQPRTTTSKWRARGEVSIITNGTQQHN